MDAPREIQWLKRIMKELGDDRELANKEELVYSRQEASGAAVRPRGASMDDEDDTELDCLLHRATVLLRRRVSNSRLRSAPMGDAREKQRAIVAASLQTEQEENDDELDRLLRRAMLLFTQRRQRTLNGEKDDESAELEVVWLKTIQSVVQQPSPGSPGTTDDEEDDDEDDDELDELLIRALALSRRPVRAAVSNQGSPVEVHSAPVVETEASPKNWRKTLRQQHLNQVQQGESQKRPRTDITEALSDRKSKRARCLVELHQETHAEFLQIEERPSLNIFYASTTDQVTALEATESSVYSSPSQLQPGNCVTPTTTGQQQSCIIKAKDDELQTLRAANAKLVAENSDLRQQLQSNNSSNALMVILLQEQVQRLQQRELEP